MAAKRAGKSKAKPIAGRRGTEVLFFDLAEIDQINRVRLSVCQATKHPNNPVMIPGDKDKWDSAQSGPWSMRTVLYDPDMKKFRCWYTGTDIAVKAKWYNGYAESDDGIVWHKPNLGLFSFEGSKRNNIINDAVWCSTVLDESERKADRRYKSKTVHLMAYSADGLHWSRYEPNRLNTLERPADLVTFIRDDQEPNPARRYKVVYQYYTKSTKPGPELVRAKGIAYSRDGKRWRGSKNNPILSPNDGFEQENHFVMYVPYKGQYLTLYECGWYHPDGTGLFGRYSADIRLAHSRDGEKFQRVNPHEVVLPRGGAGEWDGQFLVITDKIIIKDDLMYIYYCGQDMGWTSWPTSNSAPGNRFIDPKTHKETTGCTGRSAMGLATMRVDGFTCMQAVDAHSWGTFTTVPINLGADKARPRALTVNLGNVEAGRSYLAAEVVSAGTGKPIDGFSRDDCTPIAIDGTKVPVRWKGGALSRLKAKRVRIRFYLYGAAKLYSFRLA